MPLSLLLSLLLCSRALAGNWRHEDTFPGSPKFPTEERRRICKQIIRAACWVWYCRRKDERVQWDPEEGSRRKKLVLPEDAGESWNVLGVWVIRMTSREGEEGHWRWHNHWESSWPLREAGCTVGRQWGEASRGRECQQRLIHETAHMSCLQVCTLHCKVSSSRNQSLARTCQGASPAWEASLCNSKYDNLHHIFLLEPTGIVKWTVKLSWLFKRFQWHLELSMELAQLYLQVPKSWQLFSSASQVHQGTSKERRAVGEKQKELLCCVLFTGSFAEALGNHGKIWQRQVFK